MILMLTQPTLLYWSCGELVMVGYSETAGYFIWASSSGRRYVLKNINSLNSIYMYPMVSCVVCVFTALIFHRALVGTCELHCITYVTIHIVLCNSELYNVVQKNSKYLGNGSTHPLYLCIDRRILHIFNINKEDLIMPVYGKVPLIICTLAGLAHVD